MYVDGIPLEFYGAKLLSFEPGFPSLTNITTPGKDYSFPGLLRSEIKPKILNVVVTIRETSYHDAMHRASKFVLALNKTTEIYGPDHLYYRSTLNGTPTFEWLSIGLLEIGFTFYSVAHGMLETAEIPRNNYPVHYTGTAPAGYIIEFTVPSTLPTFTVNGITITDIPSGAKILIDGIEKKVTQNGANKFAQTNLVNFPVFDPQAPNIIITMSQYIPMTIKYYPTFM